MIFGGKHMFVLKLLWLYVSVDIFILTDSNEQILRIRENIGSVLYLQAQKAAKINLCSFYIMT